MIQVDVDEIPETQLKKSPYRKTPPEKSKPTFDTSWIPSRHR